MSSAPFKMEKLPPGLTRTNARCKEPTEIPRNSSIPAIGDMARVQKLDALAKLVGKSMAAKFKTVRECFRFIDEDHDGLISLDEVQRLLRSCNFEDTFAAEFFDLLNKDGNEKVDFHELRAWLGPHIQPGFEVPIVAVFEPTFPNEIHEMNTTCYKKRHQTTYAEMVKGNGAMQTPRTMPGYGGHNPKVVSKVLGEPSKRDVLPRYADEAPAPCSKYTANMVASYQATGANATMPWALYSDRSANRRLNQAALVAGCMVGATPTPTPRYGGF